MVKKTEVTDIGKLQNQLTALEQTEIVKDYLYYLSLPYMEQQKWWLAWNEYYKQAKESLIAQMFYEQDKAAKEKNWGKVRELATQAKEMRENGHHITLAQPKFRDPEEFNHDQMVLNYKRIFATIDYAKKNNTYLDF